METSEAGWEGGREQEVEEVEEEGKMAEKEHWRKTQWEIYFRVQTRREAKKSEAERAKDTMRQVQILNRANPSRKDVCAQNIEFLTNTQNISTLEHFARLHP